MSKHLGLSCVLLALLLVYTAECRVKRSIEKFSGELDHEQSIDNQATELVQEQRKSGSWDKLRRCTSIVRDMIKNTFAPDESYLSLSIRYSKWFKKYNQFYQSNSDLYVSPVECIKFEFARADDKLFTAVKDKAAVVSNDISRQDVENMDYLFVLFKNVIEQLEARIENKNYLSKREYKFNFAAQEGLTDEEKLERAESEFKDALDIATDRVKRIGKNSLITMASHEIITVARYALVDAAFKVVAHQAGWEIGMIPDILQTLVGTAKTTVAMSYITNVKIRTTICALDALNPVPLLFNSSKGHQKSE